MDWLNLGLVDGLLLACLAIQGSAAIIVLARFSKGAFRRPPLTPQPSNSDNLASVTVVVPSLNEVERIQPCLNGLSQQSYEVREILVVDSNSTDGTRDKVLAAAQTDPRFRLLTDDPLPNDWVGRPWALNWGFEQSAPESKWFLGIDADTEPQPGMIASVLQAAEEEGFDLVSLSPQFILQYPGEWWLQPALLMTLLFRFDVAGIRNPNQESVMANGQCFLCKREVLEKVGGYSSAASSFCDDVTLARNIAKAGYKVGFLDGAKVIKVRMYEGMKETWEEWGRSLDLKDAASAGQLRVQVWLLTMVQGLPIPLSLLLLSVWQMGTDSLMFKSLFWLNVGLVVIRFAMLLAIAGSYDRSRHDNKNSLLFWLSPLADPLAVIRIFMSASAKSISWRGRTYRQT
ncbi:glycosyl transferase family 2 [[Leptolyngbya] sp. PCC 7376]|uniref:2'-O-glycosyltransferase CruG n=1 Tax=[Leptolyngbya] sp. PCC 7376 TaxID=111781 RepID=UPI00029EC558|nr:glycosyltransferase family 2 protein [[Leptolyngbya] sp. PCC 7376]AFY38737.1 glycosyl transferase family 2 [[Leptolyngbya] sp. PCC 7376]